MKTDEIKNPMNELEKIAAMQKRWAVRIIIDKVIRMHKMYGFTIDKICSDMKDKLVSEYGDANYPIIIEAINDYITTSAEEDTVKFALLYYLNKAC